MKLPKLVLTILLTLFSVYFFYQTYVVIIELGYKRTIQSEVTAYADKKRYEYLQIMLQEKEILSDNLEFVEREARTRLDYSKPGEIVVYFPGKPENSLKEIEASTDTPIEEFIFTWLSVLYPFDY
ncbi:hypothetical protein JW962_02510 [Candidatus Dojkabacteria bacterium]|nr:hypothetical protein [Candidatus Dojkabacteria bacterium]